MSDLIKVIEQANEAIAEQADTNIKTIIQSQVIIEQANKVLTAKLSKSKQVMEQAKNDAADALEEHYKVVNEQQLALTETANIITEKAVA